jgi:hypothetical protein
MSHAFQQMHDRGTTRFLRSGRRGHESFFPDAIATLECLIEERPENVAMVWTGLWNCDTQCLIYGSTAASFLT